MNRHLYIPFLQLKFSLLLLFILFEIQNFKTSIKTKAYFPIFIFFSTKKKHKKIDLGKEKNCIFS